MFDSLLVQAILSLMQCEHVRFVLNEDRENKECRKKAKYCHSKEKS